MNRGQIIVGIVVAIAWGAITAMLFDTQGRNIALELTVQAYKDRFSQRLGKDDTHGEYSLLTLDGGLTWWEFKAIKLPDGSEAVTIVGRANSELVRYLDKKDN